MLKIITALLFVFALGTVSAQEEFIRACQTPSKVSKDIQSDLKWFKLHYQTDDCKVIANKISKLQSFSELFVPYNPMDLTGMYSWTNKLPYLYGHSLSEKILTQFNNAFDTQTYKKVFTRLELYKEFKNLTDIPYVHAYSYSYNYTTCDVLKLLPHIKTVTIDSELLEQDNDECLGQADVEVILRNGFSYDGQKKFKSKIVGIENYWGSFKDLINFPELRYLGVGDYAKTQGGLEALSGYSGITHFSMNVKQIKDIENLGSLYNLSYLSLNCIEDAHAFIFKVCESSYLKDTSFLKDLSFLRHLNLNYNGLTKLTGIEELEDLEILELDGNNLHSLPDLSQLKKLNLLSLGGNNLASLEDVRKIKGLKFLNLSSNKITDYSGLSDLTQLTHLNLSRNPMPSSLSKIVPPDGLRVLSLNGNKNAYTSDDEFNSYITDFLETSVKAPEAWYERILKQDFLTEEIDGKPYLPLELDFSHMKQLEFLSLRGNGLKQMPDLRALPNLKYLNLESNNLGTLPSQALPQLVVLDLSDNSFKGLPDLTGFSSLKKADFIANKITSLAKTSFPKEFISLSLAENKIQNLAPLAAPKFRSFKLFLEKNPVRKNKLFCPLNSKNTDLTWFCNRLIYDLDNLNSDPE
jgi:hypothetical protein